jgi:hypothetical protein
LFVQYMKISLHDDKNFKFYTWDKKANIPSVLKENLQNVHCYVYKPSKTFPGFAYYLLNVSCSRG